MVGQFMIIFFAVLIVLAAIGFWMKKYTEKSPDKVLENVSDWGDTLNRARYQGEDSK